MIEWHVVFIEKLAICQTREAAEVIGNAKAMELLTSDEYIPMPVGNEYCTTWALGDKQVMVDRITIKE